jgi:hypothetical protein
MILPGELTSPVKDGIIAPCGSGLCGLKLYIFVDADGKELRREPKLRGRTKAGAVEKSPGIWVVRDGIIAPLEAGKCGLKQQQQSWYVYVDANGNEIRREKKGRGRVKKEAIQKSPGMWYIVEGATRPIPAVTQNISVVAKNATIETDEDFPLVETPSGEVIVPAIIPPKRRNPTKKIILKTLKACMKPMSTREDGQKIIAFGVVMLSSPPGLDGIEMNDVYHEVTIDKIEKSIGFLSLPGHTELVFVDALQV